MHINEMIARLETAEALLAGLRGQIQAERPAGAAPASQPLGFSNPSVTVSSAGVASGQNGLSIDYRGVATCPYGRSATQNQRPFEAIVVHHTGDTHTTDWYVQYQIDGDPGRGGHHFGYHFYIAPDGLIIQGAPLTKRTNHVKRSSHARRRDFGRHANNTNALGITCAEAGKPDFQPTPEQLTSLNRLVRAIAPYYGIGFDRIYGHGEIQTDRHPSEGTSAAAALRGMPEETGAATSWPGSESNDDLDDTPVHEASGNRLAHRAPSPLEALGRSSTAGLAGEDDDDGSPASVSWPVQTSSGAWPQTALTGSSVLRYTNQSAIRSRPCTKNLENRLVDAVTAVYGGGCTINIYSGGQGRPGQGLPRTGSIRHDDYGQGGRAADIHVFDANAQQIRGLELARLGQYWLAAGYGCVGHEMSGGGIHLDEWTPPPAGGGRFWTYAASNGQPWAPRARQMLMDGANGVFP